MAFKAYDKESKGEIPSSLLGTVMKNLGHSLKPDQLQERLGLHTLKDRQWYIQPCSATKGKYLNIKKY